MHEQIFKLACLFIKFVNAIFRCKILIQIAAVNTDIELVFVVVTYVSDNVNWFYVFNILNVELG